MVERMMLLSSVYKHITGIAESFHNGGVTGNIKEIVLACHHFPISVYEFLNDNKYPKISTLLKKKEIFILAGKEQLSQLKEDCNLVSVMSSLLIQNTFTWNAAGRVQ